MGRLAPIDSDTIFVTEVRAILEESSYVREFDNIGVFQGVMEGVYTPDATGFTPYVNQMFLHGTLANKERFVFSELFHDPAREDILHVLPLLEFLDIYVFSFYVDEVIVALPDLIQKDEVIHVGFIDYRKQSLTVYEDAVIGQQYLLKGQFSWNMNQLEVAQFENNFNSVTFVIVETEDEEEAFFERVVRPIINLPRITSNTTGLLDGMSLLLQPLNAENDIFLYPIGADGQITDADILARTNEEIEVLNQNIHSIFLRPTMDLSTNPLTTDVGNQAIRLLDGRFINRHDNNSGNRVANIHQDFANLRGLSVGDTLRIAMRNRFTATEYWMPNAHRNFPLRTLGEVKPFEEWDLLWWFVHSYNGRGDH